MPRPFLLLLVPILFVSRAAPVDAKVALCPPGRFLVVGEPLVTGAVATPAVDAIVIAPQGLSIDSGCGAVVFRQRTTKKGTRLRARWPFCQTGNGKVRLRALLAPSCDAMNGTFRMRHTPARPFHAVRTRCGDGIVDRDGGEECDDGNLVDGDGCDADCTVPPRSVEGAFIGTTPSGDVSRQLNVLLTVRPGSGVIDMSMTAVTPFLFCSAPALHIIQGSQQMQFVTANPNPGASMALATWNGFSGCDTLNQGVVESGTLSQFPSWFDARAAFRVVYNLGPQCNNKNAVCEIDVPALQ
jgi:cysteine-rich repeat protein